MKKKNCQWENCHPTGRFQPEQVGIRQPRLTSFGSTMLTIWDLGFWREFSPWKKAAWNRFGWWVSGGKRLKKKIYIYIYIYINTFRSPWIGFLIRFWGGGTNPGFSELIFMVLIFMRFAHLPQFFKAFELHLYPITEGGRGEVCWPPLLPAFEPECSKSYVKSKEEARFWVLISHTPITLVVLVVGSDVPTPAKLYLIYIFRYIWL